MAKRSRALIWKVSRGGGADVLRGEVRVAAEEPLRLADEFRRLDRGLDRPLRRGDPLDVQRRRVAELRNGCRRSSRARSAAMGWDVSRQERFGLPVCGTDAAATSAEKIGWLMGLPVYRSLPLNDESTVAQTGWSLLVGIGQEGAHRAVLEPPVGHDVPVALGLVHRADEALAGVLDQGHGFVALFHAGAVVGLQAAGRRGGAALAALEIDIDQALEDVDLAAPAGRHFDAELGALIDEGGLGRKDLEAAGRLGLDFHRGLAHIQFDGAGRQQLERGRALQDDLGPDVEVDLGHAGGQVQRLPGGERPVEFRGGRLAVPAAVGGADEPGDGGSRERGAGRGGEGGDATSCCPRSPWPSHPAGYGRRERGIGDVRFSFRLDPSADAAFCCAASGASR